MKKITYLFCTLLLSYFSVTAQVTVSSKTICTGTTTTLTASGTTTYVWSTGATTASIVVNPTVTTTYTVIGTTSPNTYTATATVTVNAKPTMTSANSASICSGTAVNLSLAADIASSFTWKTNNHPYTTGESTTTQTVSVITNTLVNTTASPTITAVTLAYTVTPTSTSTLGGCAGTAQLVNITVNPAPTLTTSTTLKKICSGQSVNLPLGANIPANYTWIAANNPAISGESTTLQSTSTITDTLSVLSTAPYEDVYFYTITPISTAGCVGAYKLFEVTVYPPLQLTGTLSKTICSGTTVNYSFLTTGYSTKSYTWSATDNSNVSGESLTGQISNSITDALVNPSSTPQQVIYTVTPSSTNLGDINCTSPAQTVTITVNPIPTITVTPATQTICSGATLSIPLLTNIGTLTWKGNSNANITGESTSTRTVTTINDLLTNTSNPTSYQDVTYTVTATSAGCASTQTVNVTVAPKTTVNAQTICLGTTATLTGTGATTYVWNNGATTVSINVSPTTSTTYTVTGTLNSCTSTATPRVTVNPTPPTVIITPTQTICAGSTATLTASGATTYVWNTGATTASISVSPTTTSAYTVTGTTNACSSVKTTTVTVNALPTLTVTPGQTVCAGSTTTLTVSGANAYAWNTGATTVAISVSPTTMTTYTVTGTNGLGCSSITTTAVTVNTVPSLTVSPGQTICTGSTTTLTVSGASIYAWSTGATTTFISVSPTTITTYSVTGTNSCGSNSASIAAMYCCTIPTITVTNPQTICDGVPTILTASGATYYTWSPSTGLDNTTSSYVTATPTTNTTYTVVGTNFNVSSELVVNGNFSSGDTGFQSDNPQYPNNDNGTTGFGYYDIKTPTSTAHNIADATSMPDDHTNPGSGNYFYVASDGANNDMVWKQTITGIQPYTDYVISYWLNRIDASISGYFPIWHVGTVKLVIDGTAYTTNVPQLCGQWYQVTHTWNSGNNTSGSVALGIRLDNANPSSFTPGDIIYGDLGIDDISLHAVNNSCSSSNTTSVIGNPLYNVVFTTTDEFVCTVDSSSCWTEYIVTATNNVSYSYSWSSGGTSNSFRFTKTLCDQDPDVTELLSMSTNSGCVKTFTITGGCNGSIQVRNNKNLETKLQLQSVTNSETYNFIVYPNPNNGTMTLNYSLSASDNGSMEVYDLLGRLVVSYVLDSNGTQLQINATGVKSGTYYYKVIVNGTVVKHDKIIILQQ